MGKTEQEVFNVLVNVSLSKISGCLSNIAVQIIFAKNPTLKSDRLQ